MAMKRIALLLALCLLVATSLSACRNVSYMAGQAAGWVTTAPIRMLKGG
ncbi:MAG: hypothetical protein ACAH83_01135 [Alphaproteobacteria bacterium]